MASNAWWIRASSLGLLTLVALPVIHSAGPAAPAVMGTKTPFAPLVMRFPFEGMRGITLFDRPGRSPGSVAATLFASDAVVLIRAGHPAPAAGDRFAVGDGPFAVVAGPLDRDGHDDLVVVNLWSTDLSILMSRPGGGFWPERRQALPSVQSPDDFQTDAAQALVLADFDADGCLDFALGLRAGIETMRGDCRGGFRPIGKVFAGYQPVALVTADFDLDGNVDLAASHLSGDYVSVLLGRGDGTFTILPGVPAGFGQHGLATGDLNGDGLPDLVTANWFAGDQREPDGDISVLLGAGGGALHPPVRYRAGRSTFSVSLADFDRDGDLDIAAGNIASSDASIFMGTGDGTFATERRAHVGPDPAQLLAVDHDGDGRFDLVASLSSAGVAFVTGRGDGTFDTPDSTPHPIRPTSATAADLDGDGHQDLIVAGRSTRILDDLAILPGRGGGRFAPALAFDTQEFSDNSFDLAAADLDEDGIGDLVRLNGYDAVGVNLVVGGWTLSPTTWITTSPYARALAIADFDRDRHLDIAVAHGEGAGIILLEGLGDGGFIPGVSIPGDELDYLEAGDLDGDGIPDLVASGGRFDPSTGRRHALFVRKGDGSGGFGAPLLLDLPSSSPVGIGDVDGDRRPDLIATTWFDVILFRNLGGMSFGPPLPCATGQTPGGLIVADVTGDGLADAITINADREIISLCAGSRDGSLHPASSTVTGLDPAALVAADFDGDGAIDLATANIGERDAFVGSHPDVTLLLNRAR